MAILLSFIALLVCSYFIYLLGRGLFAPARKQGDPVSLFFEKRYAEFMEQLYYSLPETDRQGMAGILNSYLDRISSVSWSDGEREGSTELVLKAWEEYERHRRSG